VHYRVEPKNREGFLQAMRKNERVRRRDGASRWGLYRDLERADLYLETFIVVSWAEHLRQHERVTRSDGDVERLVQMRTDGEPTVRHFIHAESGH
jgi:Transmembrane secretion effector